MKSIINYSFILSAFIVFASCNEENGAPADTSNLTVTAGAFEITILSPKEDGHSLAGYSMMSGECGRPGYPIEISGPLNLFSICQDNYQWSAPVSAIDSSIGDVTYTARLRDRNMTSGSPVVVRIFSKIDGECLVEENRSKLFANFDNGGNGSTTPYKICTPKQLSNIRFYPSSKFELSQDINFSNAIFKPISGVFSGELDGRGFTLGNLIIKDLGGDGISVGLFKTAKNATVRNLLIKNTTVEGYQRLGVLAGDWRGTGTIDNIKIQGSVTGISRVGGLIGIGNTASALTISNINSNINISGNEYVGGVVSFINSNDGQLNISDSKFYGNISGKNYVGGLVGRLLENTVTFENVEHRGNITSTGINVGGLVGESTGGTFVNVSHVGVVSSTVDAVDSNVGGLFGITKGISSISNSHVVADILSGGHYVGGLVGRFLGGSITDSYSRGSIIVNDNKYNSVTKFVGGLVGNINQNTSLTNSHSKMFIDARAQFVGGLVGYFNGDTSIILNSYSTGNITAKTSFVGGLVGQFNGQSINESFSRSEITVDTPTPNAYIGGISGHVNNPLATFSKLYNSGDITATNGIADKVGGLFGYIKADNIMNVFNTGEISGTRSIVGGVAGYLQAHLSNAYSSGKIDSSFRYVGGVIGLSNNKNLRNLFFTGSIEGASEVGGIVGWQLTSGTTLTNSYSMGTILKKIGSTKPDSMFGPIFGISDNEVNVSNVYYKNNMELIHQGSGSALAHNSKGVSLTDGQLRNSIYLDGFDFINDWNETHASYRLPFMTTYHTYPVLNFLTAANYGFTLPEVYSDDPMSEAAPPLFANQGNVTSELSPEIVNIIKSSTPVTTVTVGQLQISIVKPIANGAPITKTKLIYGECGVSGYPIQIHGDVILKTICQPNNRWAALIDASSLPIGNVVVNIQIKNPSLTSSSPVVSRILIKSTNLCSSDEAASGIFANSHLGANGDSIPYKICHSGHFKNISYYSDKKFELANDIDFAGNTVTPVASTFSGELDGKGFAIKNYIVTKRTINAGLFSLINSATIKNLKLENFVINGYDRSGGLAGTWSGDGSLTNVTASGHVNGITYTGGLIGVLTGANLTLSNLNTTINIIGNDYTGGVIGHISTTGGSLNATNLVLSNTVTGRASVGGFMGYSKGSAMTLSNISQSGIVTATQENVGGLFGQVSSITLNKCNISGQVNSTYMAKEAFVGGVIGKITTTANIDDCQFNGTLNAGGDYVGGVIGYIEKGVINNSQSSGTMNIIDTKYNSTRSFAGGIVGKINENSTVSAISSNMVMNVESQFAGGLIGRFDGDNSLFTTSYFTGTLNARTAYVGGLAGLYNGTRLENSYSTGAVNVSNATKNANIGGLLGYANRPTSIYKNLYATGNVSITSGIADYVGGLIGYFRGGTLSNSYATGVVSGGRSSIGGLVGLHRGLTKNSYASGNVSGSFRFVGGLIGYLYLGSVEDSMALGDVESKAQSGGLLGFANTSANAVKTSYAFGTVSRLLNSTEDESLFGPIIGVELNAGAVASSVYYQSEKLNANHNSTGTAIAGSNASTAGSYTGFNFGSSPGWRMPVADYNLPGVSGTYTYPIPSFIEAGVTVPQYQISGAVSGLQHSNIIISLNNGETITLNPEDNSFVFTTELTSSADFTVAIEQNTASPSITCTVQNGTGVVGNADVTGVNIDCPVVDSLDILVGNPNLALGSTSQLTIRGTLSNSQFIDLTDFSFYDFSVAEIVSANTTGLLTAIGEGTTNLTVNYLDVDKIKNLNVYTSPNPPSSVAWLESTPRAFLDGTSTWIKSSSGNITSQRLEYFKDGLCSGAIYQTQILENTVESHQINNLTNVDSYYFTVTAINSNNLETKSTCSQALAISVPAPDPVAGVTTGSVWVNGTLPISSPLVSWVNPAKVDDIKVALGSSWGGAQVSNWSSIGDTASHSFTGLNGLTECTAYFPSVKVLDQYDNESSVTTDGLGFRWDNTAPENIAAISISGDATVVASGTFSWTQATDNCSLRYYEMAIGTTIGGTEISSYKFIGNVTSYQAVNGANGFALNLEEGIDYYTSIRTVDYAGNRSSGFTSSSWQVHSVTANLPDLILWLDAADKTSLIDRNGVAADGIGFTGKVATWNDISGSTNTHNFFSEASESDPSFGENAIIFNGSAHAYTVNNHDEINLKTVQEKNITLSFKTENINNRQVIYEEGGRIRGMNLYISEGKLYCGFWNIKDDGDGKQAFVSVSSNIETNSIYHVTWNYNYSNYTGPDGADGDLECYVNGESIGSAATTTRIFPHSGNIGIGAMVNDTYYETGAGSGDGDMFRGELFEVMITTTAPTADDISTIHSYLIGKWSGDTLYSPSNLVMKNNADLTSSATLSWNAMPASFDIDYYDFAVGTTVGGTEVLYWTDIGNVLTYQAINGIDAVNMALAYDTNYYIAVRGVDTFGNKSIVATSHVWSIVDVTAGLPDMILWLDSSDLATVKDSSGNAASDAAFNGFVSTWEDRSGSTNRHDFVVGNAPGFDDISNSIVFNGTDNILKTNNHDEINLTTVTEKNISFAFKISDDISTRQVLYEEGGGTRGMNLYIDEGKLYCGFWNRKNDGDGLQDFISVNTNIDPNTYYYVSWVFDYSNYTGPNGDDGNLDCYVNQINIGSANTTSRMYPHSGAIGLGANNGSSRYHDGSTGGKHHFSGEIFEVMITNTSPSESTVHQLHSYMQDKWEQ